MSIFITSFLALVLIEFLIKRNILKHNKTKWIITNKKSVEQFDKIKFNNFKEKNYNYELGWDKKKKLKKLRFN